MGPGDPGRGQKVSMIRVEVIPSCWLDHPDDPVGGSLSVVLTKECCNVGRLIRLAYSRHIRDSSVLPEPYGVQALVKI